MIQKILLILIVCMALPPFAQACLDPGNGSMMVQLLLAELAGLTVALKLFGRRIPAFFQLARPVAPDDRKPSE